MTNLRHLISFFLVFVLHALTTTNALGCSCIESEIPPCAAYWRADAVFVGSITAIIPPPQQLTKSLPEATLRLSVEEAFRGAAVGTILEVLTLSGTSCDSSFNIGNRYLIYGHRDSTSDRLHIPPCDRTKILSDAGEDLAYIRGLSRNAPIQTILGRVSDGRHDPMSNIPIKVVGAGKEYQAITDQEGRYRIDIAQPGMYRVRAFFPFAAVALDRPDFLGDPTEEQTVLQYEVNITNGHCDYREIHVLKVDLRARAEISGNVVNTQNKGVPHLTLYLYPETAQSASGGDYELATTDAEGNYSFKGLKAGRYRLGVNLWRMPDVSAPYPTTFYPGVPLPEQATILSLDEGQKLIERVIQLPAKLVEREVTGAIFWPVGKPAAKPSGSAPQAFGPMFSIRDPADLTTPLNPFREDRTITQKVDETGQFSFVGFEGYSYVIHVHASDSEGRIMHAKHVKVKVEGVMKPIKLVLSLPGYGERNEEIRKELEYQK
jgi:hypothetical protein